MSYTGSYFYPPRTESRIPYKAGSLLDMWKGFSDSVAQLKLNGNRNLVKVSPDGKVEFWNRHGEEQKYSIPAPIRDYFLEISPRNHWTVWDSELLHTKTKDVKNVVYVFDCLVWESEHLLGKNYGYRYKICTDCIGDSLTLNDTKQGVYLASNYKVDAWDKIWEICQDFSFVEGLVLKRTGSSSILTTGTVPVNNSGFMCRVRKPGKNYMF